MLSSIAYGIAAVQPNVRGTAVLFGLSGDEKSAVEVTTAALESAISKLAAAAALPPTSPVPQSCHAPPSPQEAKCADAAFTGERRSSPAKLLHLVEFSFEADALEILLHEVAPFAHKVVLVESPFAHQRLAKKPLLYADTLRHDARFLPFANKIDTITVPTSLYAARETESQKATGWTGENAEMDYGPKELYRRYKDTMGPDDLVIAGDVDEIPAARVLHELRWCTLKPNITASAALWMPMGQDGRAFASDWPAVGYPHSFSNPKIFRWDARTGDDDTIWAKRAFDSGSHAVLGGLHLTNPPVLAMQLLKAITGTSYNLQSPEVLEMFARIAHGAREADQEQAYVSSLDALRDLAPRVTSVAMLGAEEKAKVVYTPWLLACAHERFGWFYGKPDPRNANVSRVVAELVAEPGGWHEQATRDVARAKQL